MRETRRNGLGEKSRIAGLVVVFILCFFPQFASAGASSSARGGTKSTGVVIGHLVDEETEQGVPKVQVYINRTSATTSQNGKFVFKNISPGSYFLDLDENSLPSGQIATAQLPISINVSAGELTVVRLSMVTAADLATRLVLYEYAVPEDPEKDAEPKLVRAGVLPDALVEVSNGLQIKRRVSNDEGYCTFKRLPSGAWRLNVKTLYLAGAYEVDGPSSRIRLAATGQKLHEVKMVPKGFRKSTPVNATRGSEKLVGGAKSSKQFVWAK